MKKLIKILLVLLATLAIAIVIFKVWMMITENKRDNEDLVLADPWYVFFNGDFHSYCGADVKGITVKALIKKVKENNLRNPDYQIFINVTSTNEIDPESKYTVVESYDDSTGVINKITITKN